VVGAEVGLAQAIEGARRATLVVWRPGYGRPWASRATSPASPRPTTSWPGSSGRRERR